MADEPVVVGGDGTGGRPFRVAFLTLYPVETASTRQRIHKNVRLFPATVRAEILPGITAASLRRLGRRGGGRLARLAFLVEEAARKLGHLWRARRADVVVVQKGLTSLNLRGFPALLRRLKRPIVFDFDDAVHLEPAQAPRSAWLRPLADRSQVRRLFRMASVVVAGNRHLAAAAAAYNPRVVVVPTPMDTDWYRPRGLRPPGPVVVGWSGSTTTNHYLARLAPALREAAARCPLEFRVISNDDRGIPWERFAGIPTRFVPWRLDSLVEDLLGFDIGLMPLEDDEWSRAKCGGKVLQYMACAIPAVASPVGINRDVIEDGVTGYLASGQEEWVDRILRLAGDADLRARMGREARRRVEAQWCNRVTAPALLAALEAARRQGCGR